MNELSLIEEQSIKATRFAHWLLLTVCLAAFVFSFSPIEESIYKKAVNEINALLSLDMRTLQINGAINNKEIHDYYEKINSVLKEFGFTYLADMSQSGIIKILPKPPHPHSYPDFSMDEIYTYLTSTKELSVSIVKLPNLEDILRNDFSKNKQRYSNWSKFVKISHGKRQLALTFGNTFTAIELKAPVKNEQIKNFKVPFDALAEIIKDPRLSPLVIKIDETLLLMDSLKRVWDKIRSENPIQARAILARMETPQDRRLEVFGLSIPQNLISWIIPVLVFAFGINLLTHVAHLNLLANKNQEILSYPWIGIMPGNLARCVSAVTIVVFPILSLISIGRPLLFQQSLYVQVTAIVFSIASIFCLVFVYYKIEKLKTLQLGIILDGGTMHKIVFYDGEKWDGNNGAVILEAQINGTNGILICRVHSEVLRDKFKAASSEKQELLNAFRLNRRQIEKIAERLIESQRFESDGTIVIRKEDM